LNETEVAPDAAIVTAMKTGLEAAPARAAAPGSNPLLGGQRGAQGRRGG
jgi:hypothetical protein